MITSHLMCANFFMINLNVLQLLCYNILAITETLAKHATYFGLGYFYNLDPDPGLWTHTSCNYVFKTSWKTKNVILKTSSVRLHQDECLLGKNTFLQDSSRRLLLIFRKLDIQTFNSKQICLLNQYMSARYIL